MSKPCRRLKGIVAAVAAIVMYSIPLHAQTADLADEEVKKIATYAETYNQHVQPHNCAAPVSTASAVQLDACTTNFIIQELFPYRQAANYALVDRAFELEVKDGYLDIPTEPGLGLVLNEDVIGQYPVVSVP